MIWKHKKIYQFKANKKIQIFFKMFLKRKNKFFLYKTQLKKHVKTTSE